FGSANPASVSPTVTAPVNGNTVSMSSATASMRGLLIANIAMAAASSPRTTASSAFIADLRLLAASTPEVDRLLKNHGAESKRCAVSLHLNNRHIGQGGGL